MVYLAEDAVCPPPRLINVSFYGMPSSAEPPPCNRHYKQMAKFE